MGKINPEKRRKEPGKSHDSKLAYLEQEVNSELVGATGYGWSPEVKDKALAMYLYGAETATISRKLGIESAIIGGWIRNGKWAVKRAEIFKRTYERTWASGLSNQAGVSQNILQAILDEQLQKKMASDAEMDWKEIRQVASMIAEMQKVSRTEDGKPTEIVETRSLREQKQEIRMIIREDPFQEFHDAIEVKEKRELNGPDESIELRVCEEDREAQLEVGPASGTIEGGEGDLPG